MNREGTKGPVALMLAGSLLLLVALFTAGYESGRRAGLEQPAPCRCRCEPPGEPVPGYPGAQGSTTFDEGTLGWAVIQEPLNCPPGVNYAWSEEAEALVCETSP